ncbi:FUSC family protein [Micromonospora sp. CPCC 205711]|uniref:FUSC family protein n=1 Tax=Micromonospora sp. CPCC 205547 TaxID=3122400 RepID=UPI002FF29BA2
MRDRMRPAADRLRRGAVPALEAAAAATLAWIIAAQVIGHPDPFFAPSAALIVLGETRGKRLRQTLEMVLGVAAGILAADLAVQSLEPGTGTVFLVLLLTIGVMLALGASSTLTIQAAISALYLVAVAAPKGTMLPFRFVDALIGGAVALAASQLMVARDPLAPLVAQARQTFADLADLLGRLDEALAGGDEAAADAALDRARELDGCVDELRTAVEACGESLRLRVRKRRHLGQIEEVEATCRQLDYAVRNIRVLARNAVTLTRLRTGTPTELGDAIRALRDAVRAAADALSTDLRGSEDATRYAERADAAAMEAVRIAAGLLRRDPPLPVVMIVGQIRATAIDLMRGVGVDDGAVLGRVDEACGLPDRSSSASRPVPSSA